ncbi:hypothetical protein JXA80_02675, partial [bacterium]|nr:hypothetical protein [candidate division CSSED10-310 bacterium]
MISASFISLLRKQWIGISTALCFVVLCLPVTVSSETIEDRTNGAFRSVPPDTNKSTVPLLPDSGGKQGSVLWDTHHGVYISYQPSGFYSELTALLTSLGFTVEANNSGILNLTLDSYDLIVISLGSAWYSAYSPAEVTVLLTYIANGGSLLIMSDNLSCPNSNIAPVTSAFGVTSGSGNISGDTITTFAAHPIFSGISTLRIASAGEISAVAPSTEIAWSSTSQGFISVADLSPGRVIVIGDINLFENSYLSSYNNIPFAMNLFEWLTEYAATPTPTPTDVPTATPTDPPTATPTDPPTATPT